MSCGCKGRCAEFPELLEKLEGFLGDNAVGMIGLLDERGEITQDAAERIGFFATIFYLSEILESNKRIEAKLNSVEAVNQEPVRDVKPYGLDLTRAEV